MKRPIGSQSSFSNLDGARASIASDDRLSISVERQEEVEVDEEEGTVSFPAASPELPHATPWTEDVRSVLYATEDEMPGFLRSDQDEKPGWNESYDEWVNRYWGKYPPIDDDEMEAKWKKWKEQMKEEKEKEEKNKNRGPRCHRVPHQQCHSVPVSTPTRNCHHVATRPVCTVSHVEKRVHHCNPVQVHHPETICRKVPNQVCHQVKLELV